MQAAYICPAVTALDKQGSFSPEDQSALYERLIAHGLDGVLVLGSIGEFFSMNLEQKRQVARHAVTQVAGRMPVYVGCTSMVMEETVQLASFALDAGADGVVLLPPYYFPLEQEDIARYYGELAQAIHGPVFLYNFPARTGYAIAAETVARLAEAYPNIVGIKDTIPGMDGTREILQQVRAVRPDFRVYSGFDDNFAHNVLSGGAGCIAGISNFAPEVVAAFRDAARSGDAAQLAQRQQAVNDLMGIYAVTSPFVSAIKGAMLLRGILRSAAVTKPFAPASQEQLDRIRALLERHGLL